MKKASKLEESLSKTSVSVASCRMKTLGGVTAEGEVNRTGRDAFNSLLLLMRQELLWGWCCCSGLCLCASGPLSSFHLLRTLAARSK